MPYADVNRIRLYYELHGPEGGPPVVFINGLLMDTTGWGLQLPLFRKYFRVLLYDCRGQGRSDAPEGPYLPEQHEADLLALLDALHIDRAHLVGLSNGGVIAMYVASAQPHRVARLVLADTYAYADAQMAALLDAWLAALDTGGPTLRFDVATPWVWSRHFLAAHADVLATLREKAAGARVHAVRALIEGAKAVDLRGRLGNITAPTLILAGEEDVLTPAWRMREIAAAIPQATLITISGAGHALTIEQAALFTALAQEFLHE